MKNLFFKSAQQLKDKRKRASFSKNEVLAFSLATLFESNFSKVILQGRVSLSDFSNRCLLKNRCLLTGRKRAVFQKFRLSRITFRESANNGLLPGIKRSA
jgi:ribosomal protein S14